MHGKTIDKMLVTVEFLVCSLVEQRFKKSIVLKFKVMGVG